MTDKLARIRAKTLLTPEEKGKIRAKIPGTTNVIEFALEVSDRTAKAQQANDFNTPIPIEGGVCPRCKGSGWGQFNHNRNAHCDDCKGTGKLDKTITVREAIERVVKDGR